MASRIASLEAQRELAKMQDEFIATISHELRTPLGFIKGYVTTLLRDDVEWDPTNRGEFLRIVDEETDRLRELIDNLLDSSRLESGSLAMACEPTQVAPLVRDTVERTVSAYPEMTLSVEVSPELPPVDIDPTRIAQVLDNLLSNAYKYAPDAPVFIRATPLPDFVRIEVQDEGPGISAEHVHHLFERFYQVPSNHRSLRGTGLGLYICRKIIEAHRGEIGVESQPGAGSRFFFTLPLATSGSLTPSENTHEPD